MSPVIYVMAYMTSTSKNFNGVWTPYFHMLFLMLCLRKTHHSFTLLF